MNNDGAVSAAVERAHAELRRIAAARAAIGTQLDNSIETIEKVAGLLHMKGISDLGNTLDGELRKLRNLRR